MRAEIATFDWPDGGAPWSLFDSEEQDEPLAGQDHSLTIQTLVYPLYALRGPNCFVASELRVHRDPLNLHDYREPDILVALGVADWVRPRYELWVERKAPDLVIEVLSPSSVENKDLTEKRDWYRKEGVQEYVVLDPSGKFAPEPRLQAWRLGNRADGSADVHRTANGEQPLWSEMIPFGWRVVEGWVRVADQATGEIFPWITDVEPQFRREVELRREAQEQAGEAQEQARLAQEQARLAQEQARLADEQAQHDVRMAQLAARQVVEEAQEQQRLALLQVQIADERERRAVERADQEAVARRALEEELARLRRNGG